MKPAVGRLLLLIMAGAVVWGKCTDMVWEKAGRQYEENARIAARYPVEDLKKAIDGGDVKTLKQLLDEGVPASCPLPWSKDAWEGYPPPTNYPIHLAAGSGHVEIVRLLLDHGASAKAHGCEGNSTPLHAANGVEIAKLLISRGADVNARDDQGWQPVHNAAYRDDRGEDGVATQLALIKLLIRHGADPLAEDSRKFQPIHAAAESGTVETVEFFLGKGARVDANVNDKDDYFQNGWQPLHLAANRQDADESAQKVCRLLLAKGADTNALSDDGETPLHLSRSAAVTLLLLESGAKIHVMSTGTSKMLPTHRFALHGDAESLRLLLDRGADPNALTGNPGLETPLDIAVFYNRRTDAVELLLEHGAKPTQRTLAAAKRSKNTEMIRLIGDRLDSHPKRPIHRR